MPDHKKNLFEMGASFSDGWESDNKQKNTKGRHKHCEETLPPEKHQLHFAKEKRRGKTVTLVKPFCLEKHDLQSLLKTLKKKLGTGGTVKNHTLEFQGEISGTLRKHLETLGFRFKSS